MAKETDYLARANRRVKVIDYYQGVANLTDGLSREEIAMVHKDLDRLIKRHRRLREADMWLDNNSE